MLQQLGTLLLDIVFPTQCLLCTKPGTLLCASCAGKLPIRPVLLRHPSTNLASITVCANYEDAAIRQLITAYKFNGIRELASPLGRILEHGMRASRLPQSVLLMPIPLHRRRENNRGFNQSELLAKYLAQTLDMRLDLHLKRIRARRPQHTLNRKERLTNVRDVFQYESSAAPETILLIDDIATTFATLAAAADELKKHGTKTVHALVIAKNDP